MEKIILGKRSPHRRIIAMVLVVLMVFTTLDFSGVMIVSAEDGITKTIIGFATLADDVREQQVAIGTAEEDLNLPDTLTVTVKTDTPGGYNEDGGSVSANDTEVSTESAIGTESVTKEVTLEGITWKIDTENSVSDTFDSSEEMNGACYVYTPVLPVKDADGDSLILAEGVELPEITVLVGANDIMLMSGATQTEDDVASVTIGMETTYYTSMEDVKNAVSTNTEIATIKILKETSFEPTWEIKTPVILDLNGYTLTGTVENKVIIVDGGNLTIKDTSSAKTGKLFSTGYASAKLIYISNGAFTLESGTLEYGMSWSKSSAITVDGGTVIINDGTVKGQYGIKILCGTQNASFTMNGGTIQSYKYSLYKKVPDGKSTSIMLNGGTIKCSTDAEDCSVKDDNKGAFLSSWLGEKRKFYTTTGEPLDVSSVSSLNQTVEIKYSTNNDIMRNVNSTNFTQDPANGVTPLSKENGVDFIWSGNEDAIAITYYTDKNGTKTTSADGATEDGGVPNIVGTYYVRITVPADGDYKETVSAYYEFRLLKFVAKVQESGIETVTYYPDLQSAFDSITQDGKTYTITVLADIDLGSSFIGPNKGVSSDVILDLNQHTIKTNKSGAGVLHFDFYQYKSLTIQGTGGTIENSASYAIRCNIDMPLILSGGITLSSGSDIPIFWEGKGVVTINDSVEIISSYGTSPVVTAKSIVLNGGHIINNEGASILNASDIIEINGGSLSGKGTDNQITGTAKTYINTDMNVTSDKDIYYPITSSVSHGQVTFADSNAVYKEKTYGKAGTVTFTVTPESGYAIWDLPTVTNGTVVSTDSGDFRIADKEMTFTFAMPKSEVAIAMTLEKPYIITAVDGTGNKEYDKNAFTVTGIKGDFFDWDGDGTAKIDGYYTKEDESYILTSTESGAETQGGAPKNVGDYYVKITVSEDGTYAETTAYMPITITPKTLEPSMFEPVESQYFTGSQIKPDSVSATITSGLTTDDYEIKTDGYGANNAIGTGTLTVSGKGNYTGHITLEFNIKYYDGTPSILYNGTTESDYYAQAVKITAEGYTISDSLTGTFASSYSLDGEEGTVRKQLYFKQNDTGYITDAKTVDVRMDKVAPTVTVNVPDETKKDVTAVLKVTSTETGNLEYLVTETQNAAMDYDTLHADTNRVTYNITEAQAGTEGKGVDITLTGLTENKTYYVYAFVTDIAGNTSTLASTSFTINFAEPVLVDGVYQIANASNLMWFAAYVNDTSNTANQSTNAVLTKDIDMVNIKWVAMSNYSGTFDGNGNMITGLNESLFKQLNGTVKNLVIKNSSSFPEITGGNGMITCKNNGTIEKVIVDGCSLQYGAYDFFGGIAGLNQSNGVIRNCAVINTQLTRRYSGSTTQPIGGIVDKNQGIIEGCYTYGCTFTNGTTKGGIIAQGNTPVNSYYYTSSEVTSTVDGTVKTADEFASGEVTWLLNGSYDGETFIHGETNGTQVWYQNLDNGEAVNLYPVMVKSADNSNTVYKLADGEYSNTITFEQLTALIETVETNISNGIYDGNYTTESIKLLKAALTSAKGVESTAEHEDINSAYNNLNDAVNNLVEKAFTVTLKAEPTTGGRLSGGGSFATGETIAIKAEAATGYRFDGWYEGTDTSSNLITTDASYNVATRTDDVTYTAKFTQTNSLFINVVGSGNVNLNGTTITTDYRKDVAVGTKITLNATAADGYEFVYWMDENNRVLSYQKEDYVTYVGMATTIKGVFQKVKSSESDECNYRFLNRNGNLVSSGIAVADSDVTKPTDPSLVGYTFAGWKIQGTADSELIDFTTFKITTNTVFVAVYTKEATTYPVQITGGTISGTDGLTTGDYKYDTRLTVKADAAQTGKVFSYWKNSDNQIVSYEESYSFCVGGATNLTAVFEDTKEEAVPVISGAITKTDNTNKMISFLFDREVPNGYTMVQTGCIATDDNTLGTDSDSFELGASGIDFTKVSTSTNGTGQYMWTKSNVSATWYVRGFLTYIDKDGITVTIYTDILAGFLSE